MYLLRMTEHSHDTDKALHIYVMYTHDDPSPNLHKTIYARSTYTNITKVDPMPNHDNPLPSTLHRF